MLLGQACGSGGTSAGVALGTRLSGMQAQVHAFGVCDDPNYFYSYMDELLQGLGASKQAIGAQSDALQTCLDRILNHVAASLCLFKYARSCLL